MRNHGSFSESVRAKVLAATEALDYTPNRIAGGLASVTSRLVGIVIPSISNAVMPDVLAGAMNVLEENGFQSIIGATNFDPLQEEKLVRSILSWRPRGLMIAGLDHTKNVRALLRKAHVPIVELLDIDDGGIDFVVGSSHRMAGRKSAEFLLARGYLRIGYVGHNILVDLRAGRRFEGFVSVLKERGISLVGEDIGAHPVSSVEAGREGLARLLHRFPEVDAVYFSSDNLAMGAYFYCLENKISVPRDVALFGYNGLALTDLIPQPLSTIRTPRRLIGEVGARLLLQDTETAKVVDLGFELIEGKTS
jgi:LacI family gluconate utilization system Gnt-I transcriptional repressor